MDTKVPATPWRLRAARVMGHFVGDGSPSSSARVRPVPARLRTSRLLLRPWRERDRDAFARLNASATVMRFFPQVLSRAQSDMLMDRIQAHLETHGWGLWAVEIPGVTPFAGFIGLSRPRFRAPFTPCVEVGWRLDEPFWGRAYATEGARAALDFGFQHLRLPEIVSFTTSGHARSRRVMERLGMSYDAADDFDHPSVESGHPLRRHVLYRARPA